MDFNVLRNNIPNSVIVELELLAGKFGLTTKNRLIHFLSQVSHESRNFKDTVEDLNYSEERLIKIFPKYINSSNSIYYAHKPEKLGNYVYANRLGNRDSASGDGYKFRGRGFLQGTGAEFYVKLGKFLGIDLISNPDLVATTYPLSSALFFFMDKKLWNICDLGTTDEVIKKVTYKVNGGYNGLDNRIKKFREFEKILS